MNEFGRPSISPVKAKLCFWGIHFRPYPLYRGLTIIYETVTHVGRFDWKKHLKWYISNIKMLYTIPFRRSYRKVRSFFRCEKSLFINQKQTQECSSDKVTWWKLRQSIVIKHSLNYSGVPNSSPSPSTSFPEFSQSPYFIKTPTTTNFGGFATTVTTANFFIFFAAHHNYSDNKEKTKINTYFSSLTQSVLFSTCLQDR